MDRNSHIRYGLTGQFADDGTFIVNEHTGEIYVTKALDRDLPGGRQVWNFNVLAHDETDQYQVSVRAHFLLLVVDWIGCRYGSQKAAGSNPILCYFTV